MTREFNLIELIAEDGLTKATFMPERGGMMTSLIMSGNLGQQERLFLHNFIWDEQIADLPGGWPFLFPICGRATYKNESNCYFFEGKKYYLPIHGFAWNKAWRVLDVGKNFIEMCLCDDEQTFAQFPFHFSVTLRYELLPNKLICYQQYQNLSNCRMPYNAGFHPYFLTPTQQENIILNYAPTKRFVYNSSLTDVVGETGLFDLPASITNSEINEQLTLLGKDKKINLIFANGDNLEMQALGVEDENLFSYVQIYMQESKPFICIEPWMGFPNAINQTHGMRWLEPQQIERGKLELLLVNDAVHLAQ